MFGTITLAVLRHGILIVFTSKTCKQDKFSTSSSMSNDVMPTNCNFCFLMIFIDRWLSVDSDSGLLALEIPQATTNDLKKFSSIFPSQTSYGFSEKHLWFSVVERPARSTYAHKATTMRRVDRRVCVSIGLLACSESLAVCVSSSAS